jgi:hypothetical protein
MLITTSALEPVECCQALDRRIGIPAIDLGSQKPKLIFHGLFCDLDPP